MLNKQLIEKCDFLIGVFWTRLGTHTGVAESGTVEEIEEFRRAGKPVLLYFSSRPVEPQSIDPAQYKRLTRFRNRMKKEGLIQEYQEVADLREMLLRHLTTVIDALVQPGRSRSTKGKKRSGRR